MIYYMTSGERGPIYKYENFDCTGGAQEIWQRPGYGSQETRACGHFARQSDVSSTDTRRRIHSAECRQREAPATCRWKNRSVEKTQCGEAETNRFSVGVKSKLLTLRGG